MMRRFTFSTVLCVVLACSDGTGMGSNGLVFTAGDEQADTISAELSQALNVRVEGAPPGTVVRFQALSFDSLHTQADVFVAPITSQFFGTFLADSTDASGEAHALIKLGPIVGTARLQVSVPTLDREAIATFTVRPGHAYRVVAMPRDTALYVSRSFQAHGNVTDRFGNTRTDPVIYSAIPGSSIAVSATGQVQATAIGRALYEVRSGDRADTGFVSVVPQGTIAAMRSAPASPAPELITVGLDGSNLKVLTTLSVPTFDDPMPRWSPDGSRIIYSSGTSGQSRLFTATMDGTVSRLIPSPPANLVGEIWPHYTADGAYVYFSGRPNTTNFMIWRVASDGTGAVRISPDSVSWAAEVRPAPAKDATRLAYVFFTGSTTIRMKYFGLDTTSSWSINGTTPRWDPTADRFAYATPYGGPLWLVNGDGTGARMISAPGRSYEERTYDWSSDGQWIVARGSSVLELINVSSGLTLPLGFSRDLYTPSWRP